MFITQGKSHEHVIHAMWFTQCDQHNFTHTPFFLKFFYENFYPNNSLHMIKRTYANELAMFLDQYGTLLKNDADPKAFGLAALHVLYPLEDGVPFPSHSSKVWASIQSFDL